MAAACSSSSRRWCVEASEESGGHGGVWEWIALAEQAAQEEKEAAAVFPCLVLLLCLDMNDRK